jgi:3-(3-hydroxy-phenyl)propionate hydroxylase
VREYETDGVVIVGAGPVGLTLACRLTQAGIPVLVLERERELPRASHASTFHASSLEILHRLGVAVDLIGHGIKVPHLRYRYLPSDLAVELDFASIATDTQFPFRLQCEQAALKPLLLEQLEHSPSAQVVFGAGVEEVETGDAATARGSGAEPFVARGAVLVGADGAHSHVRSSLEIDFEGSPYARPLLRVMTDDRVREIRPELWPVTYMADETGSMSFLALPDHIRLGFRVPGDTDGEAVDGQFVRGLIQRIFPDRVDEVPIRSSQLIAIHQRLAARFASENVFLIGDAAHLNDPSGGMGMNSGIHDAALLGRLLVEHWADARNLNEIADQLERRREVIRDQVIRRAEAHRSNLDRNGRDWIGRMQDVAADRKRSRDYLLRVAMFDSMPAGVLD